MEVSYSRYSPKRDKVTMENKEQLADFSASLQITRKTSEGGIV
jgi:hypothetical protein